MNTLRCWKGWDSNWPQWVKETILLIAAITGFVIAFRNDPYLYTTVVVLSLCIALFRWLIYIVITKKPPVILGGIETYRFDERYRYLALVGIALLVLILFNSLLVPPSRAFLVLAIVGTPTATPTLMPFPTLTPSPIWTATMPMPTPTETLQPSLTPTPSQTPSPTPTFTATPKCSGGVDSKVWQLAPRIESQPMVPGQPDCYDLTERGIYARTFSDRLELHIAKISHEPKVNGIYTTFPNTYQEIHFTVSVQIDKLEAFGDCNQDPSDGSCSASLIFGLGDPLQLDPKGDNGKYILFRVLETGADRLLCKTSGIIGTAGNCILLAREPFSYESDQAHILRFMIRGNEINATVDNRLVFDDITLEDRYIRRFWIGYRLRGPGEINATIQVLEYSIE